jgi:hypothetical protein
MYNKEFIPKINKKFNFICKKSIWTPKDSKVPLLVHPTMHSPRKTSQLQLGQIRNFNTSELELQEITTLVSKYPSFNFNTKDNAQQGKHD